VLGGNRTSWPSKGRGATASQAKDFRPAPYWTLHSVSYLFMTAYTVLHEKYSFCTYSMTFMYIITVSSAHQKMTPKNFILTVSQRLEKSTKVRECLFIEVENKKILKKNKVTITGIVTSF
jgi:hypothetical protein